jgi:hypothetical protein
LAKVAVWKNSKKSKKLLRVEVAEFAHAMIAKYKLGHHEKRKFTKRSE